MYETLLFYHSLLRWLVLLSLLIAIYTSYKGFTSKAIFTKTDNNIRHWVATIAHIQLIIGIVLYTQSPIVKYFFSNFQDAIHNLDNTFFAIIHISLMLCGIVIITIGSSLAKRKSDDNEKFKTMLAWNAVALLIIFIAIPWPFSPLANRPYIR